MSLLLIGMLLIPIGYLAGCLQSAYFVGKFFKKINIKEHGTGNAGATNALRVMGIKFGLLVLLLDILKTVIPIMAVNYIIFGHLAFAPYEATQLPGLLMGFGVILGHNFPFFLKFRGGKGVACTASLVLMFDWRILILSLFLAFLAAVITRYMYISSLTGFITVGTTTTLLYSSAEIIVLAWVIVALGIFVHRNNIKRVIAGKEKRLSFARNKN